MAMTVGLDSKWYFPPERLQNTPSRKFMNQDEELTFRQKAAYLIQDMGQRLRVSQLCINTAIVYMHRFYVFHPFENFDWTGIAAAALFLAAKVEEQPRKLETIIQVANACNNAPTSSNEAQDPHHRNNYQEQAQDLVFNENVLLQTLGFDVAVDHPHTHVVKTCHLVKACKSLAQTSYFLASNSLHLTTMCVQYKPTVVACFCIYLACKWSGWEIPTSTEGKPWYHYVDSSVNLDLLEQLTREFLVIYEKSPARLKTKLNSCKGLGLNKSVGESSQQRHPSQSGSSSSRSHPAGEHSRSQPNHQRPNHQKMPHPMPSGSKPSSSQMPPKALHPGVPSTSAATTSSFVSNSSRPRPDSDRRPDRSVNVPEPHFSAPQRTANSTKGPLPPLTRNNIESMSQSANNMQAPAQHQQRSSQSSHDQYYQQHVNKSRNPMTQPIPDMQRPPIKHEQRQHVKDPQQQMQQPQHHHQQQQQSKQIDPTKNPIKLQPHVSGNMYPPTDNQQRISGSSRQPPYLQQIPNLNQGFVGRKMLPPQQPQQQQSAPEHPSVHQIKHPMTDSTYKPTDDQISQKVEPKSPPKAVRIPSIFSPEWNDGGDCPVLPQRPANNGLNIKPNRDSPKKHRSETLKKEKRNDLMTPPIGNKVPSHSDKRGNIAKRPSESSGMPTVPVPSASVPVQPAAMSKNLNNISTKRPLPEDIKKENGTDFREAKQRKLDNHLSPSISVDCKANTSKLPTYPAESVPNTIYDNPLKPSFNGIETNPDLVSSLLKESLSTETKFSSSLSTTASQDLMQQSMMDTDPSKYDIFQPSATLPQQLFETPVLPQQLKLEDDDDQKSKADKKKKKDKHKHKDRSKDREERKKHKKDKDRHKERTRSSDLPPTDTKSPLKITIPKDKLLSSQESAPGAFKITIPKDRIKAEPQPPASLKIKISKDVIENYGSGQPSNPTESNSSSHSHSSKRKDKERDRERESSKRSKHSDYSKQNGNASNGSSSNGSSSTATNSNNSSSRHQSSSSSKEIWVNM